MICSKSKSVFNKSVSCPLIDHKPSMCLKMIPTVKFPAWRCRAFLVSQKTGYIYVCNNVCFDPNVGVESTVTGKKTVQTSCLLPQFSWPDGCAVLVMWCCFTVVSKLWSFEKCTKHCCGMVSSDGTFTDFLFFTCVYQNMFQVKQTHLAWNKVVCGPRLMYTLYVTVLPTMPCDLECCLLVCCMFF